MPLFWWIFLVERVSLGHHCCRTECMQKSEQKDSFQITTEGLDTPHNIFVWLSCSSMIISYFYFFFSVNMNKIVELVGCLWSGSLLLDCHVGSCNTSRRLKFFPMLEESEAVLLLCLFVFHVGDAYSSFTLVKMFLMRILVQWSKTRQQEAKTNTSKLMLRGRRTMKTACYYSLRWDLNPAEWLDMTSFSLVVGHLEPHGDGGAGRNPA